MTNHNPETHERVFSDPARAERYAKGHRQMAEKFGKEISSKLTSHGFQSGKILDVGCGFGAANLILAQNFVHCEVVGIDLSEPLIELARGDAQNANLGERVRFELADAQEIPYPDDTFDVVTNTNMVHLVDDPIKMLNEIERVLAPGGYLFIADLRRSWLGVVEKEIQSALTMDEARSLIAKSELRAGKVSWGMLWWRYEVYP
jgi:ubiquinone/menaquinone biosynthesis C-methylase UbiE